MQPRTIMNGNVGTTERSSVYIQSSSFVRCVRNIMGSIQYVVAIEIYGGACP